MRFKKILAGSVAAALAVVSLPHIFGAEENSTLKWTFTGESLNYDGTKRPIMIFDSDSEGSDDDNDSDSERSGGDNDSSDELFTVWFNIDDDLEYEISPGIVVYSITTIYTFDDGRTGTSYYPGVNSLI